MKYNSLYESCGNDEIIVGDYVAYTLSAIEEISKQKRIQDIMQKRLLEVFDITENGYYIGDKMGEGEVDIKDIRKVDMNSKGNIGIFGLIINYLYNNYELLQEKANDVCDNFEFEDEDSDKYEEFYLYMETDDGTELISDYSDTCYTLLYYLMSHDGHIRISIYDDYDRGKTYDMNNAKWVKGSVMYSFCTEEDPVELATFKFMN